MALHSFAVAKRQCDSAQPGGNGYMADCLVPVAFDFGPVAATDRQFGKDLAQLGCVGILLDQA